MATLNVNGKDLAIDLRVLGDVPLRDRAAQEVN